MPHGPEIEGFEQFLVTLGGCRGLICFELIGTAQGIPACNLQEFNTADVVHVTSQLEAYFPEAVIQERHSGLCEALQRAHPTSACRWWIFGLSREFHAPGLLGTRNFHADPHVSLVAAAFTARNGRGRCLLKSSWTRCGVRGPKASCAP